MKPRHFTILVAEDSDTDADLLRACFELAQLPHTLRFVKDGQQAIDYLQGKPPFDDRDKFALPDLFLLDIKMPIMDGFDVLSWLQRSQFDDIPVLVLSGSDLKVDQDRAKRLGADGYYVKTGNLPFFVKFLKEICEHWLTPTSRKRVSAPPRLARPSSR